MLIFFLHRACKYFSPEALNSTVPCMNLFIAFAVSEYTVALFDL